jgi:hypothetical protein
MKAQQCYITEGITEWMNVGRLKADRLLCKANKSKWREESLEIRTD